MELTSPWTSEQFWRESSGGDNGEYHSLALPGLVERLDGDRKCRILDLGPAHGATVEFFSQYSCKLYVADLYRSLKAHRVDQGIDRPPDSPDKFDKLDRPDKPDRLDGPQDEDEAAERTRIFDELLAYDGDTRFDLVLAWDLLNYLEPEQIEVLSRRLARFSHGGTKLFAMVAIHKEIPARPCAFKIRDAQTLEYDSPTHRTRAAPRHTEPALRRLMSGFDVDSTCVLRNGLQGYVFTFAPGLAHRQAS